MGKYFGTDGFRGKFGDELTTLHATKIGQFLGFYYKNLEGIIIGMDTRESSPFLKTALAMGVNASGLNVYDLDIITTPGIAYLSKKYNMPGVVISASHNPYYDNGIKIFNEFGEKLDDNIILALEEYIDKGICDFKNVSGNTISFSAGYDDYVNYLVSCGSDFSSLKFSIDLANGASYKIAKDVFKRLNANVTFLNDKPDGKNINNGCGSLFMDNIKQYSIDKDFDVSFSYDGDADRCLLIDEKQNILSGDHILYLCAKELKEEGLLNNNLVITTKMANLGLLDSLSKMDINYILTDIGDKYVYEAMKTNDSILGGEQSGHIIFRDLANSGDGILTSIKILNILKKKKMPLSLLLKDLELYPQVLKNVFVQDKDLIIQNEELINLINDKKKELVNGEILVRKSGTEPKIRVMVSYKDLSIIEEVSNIIVKKIKELDQNI